MQFNHKRKNGIALANKYRTNFENAKNQLLRPPKPKRIRLVTDYHPHIKVNTTKLKEQLDNATPPLHLCPQKKLDPYDFTLMRSFSTEYMYKPNPNLHGNYSSVMKNNKFLDLRG